jgi:hypothetical protein
VVNVSAETSLASDSSLDTDDSDCGHVGGPYHGSEPAVCELCEKTLTREETRQARQAGRRLRDSTVTELRTHSKVPPIHANTRGATYIQSLQPESGKCGRTILDVYLPTLDYDAEHKTQCVHVIR